MAPLPILIEEEALIEPEKAPFTETDPAESLQGPTTAPESMQTWESEAIVPENLPLRRRLYAVFRSPLMVRLELSSVEKRRGA